MSHPQSACQFAPLGHAGQQDLALAENAVLARELGRIQCRLTRLVQEQFGRIEDLEAQVIRLRAQAIRLLTENAGLHESLKEALTQAPTPPREEPRPSSRPTLRSVALRPFRRPCAP
ncbi:MAG: hypothetical protein QM742_11120 [Aquabacterium sp.]